MRRFCGAAAVVLCALVPSSYASAKTRFSAFRARPPIHVRQAALAAPAGMTPAAIKSAYRLPADGGSGTVAIVGAYDDATIERDLGVFSARFGLPACTTANGCFEKRVMARGTGKNAGWALETSLDVEWAHAIAPRAKVLLVEAKTASGPNLLAAVDYAAKRPDVVAVSMSWGGAEFADEASLDRHFVAASGAAFFASSGDDGAGASWPAASPNVVAVGGTTVALAADGTFVGETAWPGSGGGVSAYEPQPAWQAAYGIAKAGGRRAIPDVAYDADPASGFPVYRSSTAKRGAWYVVGGTSAGAPQWAAIRALGGTAANERFYADKASAGHAAFFRDIKSGANGDCGWFCDARRRYDYVTGLGSPLTAAF